MTDQPANSRLVRCPPCGADVVWGPDSAYRPFCSERCRLIDLGQWAEESYRIPAEPAFPHHDSVTE